MNKIEYKVKKSFRKTLSLQVRNGEVIVKAPIFVFEATIKSFVNKHIDWIKSKLEQDKNKVIYTSTQILELKQKAKDYIIPKAKELSEKFGLKYNTIKITSAKTRWGSCTSKKCLNFSYRLILTTPKVIDYVIVHELAHLKHMNHSKKFWSEVEYMMPDYKECEKWLKKHGSLIG
ncbi:MAG: M48 family metallopeptidase [Candidatus Gracilibacteria bacterium]|nr:M48 family metallopeptidase [Candidatus Gracilibacteria bacterium]